MRPGKLYLFVPLSGMGYLFPSIRLAHILQSEGNQVLFVSAIEHGITLQTLGIEHIGIRNNLAPFLDITKWYDTSTAADEFRVLDQIVNQYRPDVIVACPLALICFILSEKYSIPIINIGFGEYLYPGINDTDKHKVWRINSITEYYNLYRATLGLSPIGCHHTKSPLIGAKYLLRSVPELNDHNALPEQVQYVGYLYFEPAYQNIPLQKYIEECKYKGRRIVYIQIGRLFENKDLWDELIKVLAILPYNFIADTGRSDYFMTGKQNIPSNFFIAPFIPIGAIRNDIDFTICSGQSTTVTSSILHGKQILSIPHSADSIEYTKRLESKQLAFGIYNTGNISIEVISAYFEHLRFFHNLPAINKYQKLFTEITDKVIYNTINN